MSKDDITVVGLYASLWYNRFDERATDGANINNNDYDFALFNPKTDFAFKKIFGFNSFLTF
ncbi:MAG: hypothetical protein KAI81_06075 [Candidatus Marinimicrobia bacterium]|nr:hypothetical protein [Candidatus Neomarinimicrobiota bacterium]